MCPTPIQTLHEVLATLSREGPALEQPATALSEQEALEIGWLLWRIGQLVQQAQEPSKALLRDLALVKSRGEPGPVEFRGPGRIACTVVIQKPQMRVRPDAPTFLRNLIPAIEHGAQVGDFGLSPKALAGLLENIDIETPPPRVSFHEGSPRR